MRARLSYANVVSSIALILVLTGGAAYAANTVFSSDIVDDQVFSADVRNDTLAGGGLAPIDLRSGSVGPSEAAGLSGDDIANTAGGSDKVNADMLDGFDSSALVQGRGKLLSNRLVLAPGDPDKTLFVIPELGELVAHCDNTVASIRWSNTTTSNIDRWLEYKGAWFGVQIAPTGFSIVATSDDNTASTFALGLGDDAGRRRIATLQAFALQLGDGAPCSFQAQGTFWRSH